MDNLGPYEFGTHEPSTGEMDLEARVNLRRVAGLGTELTDVTEVEYRELRLEKVVLIGVWSGGDLAVVERSMAELAQLAETAGSQVLDALLQRHMLQTHMRASRLPHAHTYAS